MVGTAMLYVYIYEVDLLLRSRNEGLKWNTPLKSVEGNSFRGVAQIVETPQPT